MVAGVCFLLLVSLTVEGTLKGLHGYLQAIMPGGHCLGLAVFYLFDLGHPRFAVFDDISVSAGR
jgi:hypothetical protein